MQVIDYLIIRDIDQNYNLAFFLTILSYQYFHLLKDPLTFIKFPMLFLRYQLHLWKFLSYFHILKHLILI